MGTAMPEIGRESFMDERFEIEAAGLAHLQTEVLERAREFASARARAQYWADVDAWAAQDDGPVPVWHRYEPGVWQELTTLCEGLGELAAIAPELLFGPVDPWPWGP